MKDAFLVMYWMCNQKHLIELIKMWAKMQTFQNKKNLYTNIYTK